MAERQSDINGRGIPQAEGFTELKDRRIRCSCRRSTLARFYLGRDDATGEPAPWIWLPAYQAAGGRKVPPQATTVPLKAGQVSWQMVAQCSHCRATWIAFPGGVPDTLAALPFSDDGPWIMFGEDHDRAWEVGDESNTGRLTTETIAGVGPSVLVRMESVTWGTIAP